MWLLERQSVPVLRAAFPWAGFTDDLPWFAKQWLLRFGSSAWTFHLGPVFETTILPAWGIYSRLYWPQLLWRTPAHLFDRPPSRLPNESATPRSLKLADPPPQLRVRLCSDLPEAVLPRGDQRFLHKEQVLGGGHLESRAPRA